MKSYTSIKIVVITLVLFGCMLITACSTINQPGSGAGSAASSNVDFADFGPEEDIMSEVVNIHGGDEQGNNQPGPDCDNNDTSETGTTNSDASDSSEPTQSPPRQVMPLFTSFSEISLESYRLKHGADSLKSDPLTKNATRVAVVELNKSVLTAQNLNDGDRLTITVFDNQAYTVSIIRTDSNGIVALRGKTTDSSGHFYLTVANGASFATLEVPAQDAIYLVKYIPALPGYYLFRAPLNNTDAIEDSPPLIPPAADE